MEEYEAANAALDEQWELSGAEGVGEEHEDVPSEKTISELEADWNGRQLPSKSESKGETGKPEGTDGEHAEALYRLKHLDRRLEVGKDELIRLAQKGLDYDRIRKKYSELSATRTEGAEASAEAEREKNEIESFLSAFPDISARDIPQTVWDEVSRGKSLIAAFYGHERERLRAELEAERQNTRNRESCVGSRSSDGRSDRLSELERLWYEDD